MKFILTVMAVSAAIAGLQGSAAAGGVSAPPADGSCDLVAAASDGSDANPGTEARPLLTVQRLVTKLRPGQAGCLRDGLYASDEQIKVATPDVELTSFPGERATVEGRIWVAKTGDGATISHLNLDGRNPSALPSPTVNANDVTIRDDDITNEHTSICLSLGSPGTYGRAARTMIVGNAIHDCGRIPSTNQDHGIYVNSSDDAAIIGNWIYDNVDRGIQLYPDAQGTLVAANVIDGNGEGVLFGGNQQTASSGNIVTGNLIVNSTIRDDIDWYWDGPIGTANVARGNCVGSEGHARSQPSIKSPPVGIALAGNRTSAAGGGSCERAVPDPP